MISTVTQTFIAVAIVPCIPLLIYVLGILIPESHFVCRTTRYRTTPRRLWRVLTSVEEYAQWQPKLDKVVVDSVVEATSEEGRRVIFVEHSKRHRRTVMLHIEQRPMHTMLRILEERITTAVSLRSPVPTRPHVPTFTGSWTFELIYPDDHHHLQSTDQLMDLQLKISEQGVVKKPLVRLSNLLFFGFHRRIDRFMKDLERRLAQEDKDDAEINDATPKVQENEQKAADNDQNEAPPSNSADSGEPTADDDHAPLVASMLTSADTPNDNQSSNAPVSAAASTILPSRPLDKDWDLVSEIYERTTAT
ncbi:hypothetical protein BC940DRAFT_294645 [Gongronella butleri]|nr:hypothetical protein BC940DRAFT_294645 [Gongronella butleri]